MFCPLCGAQYRPGFTVCSDCQVALVTDPPDDRSANPPPDEDSEITSFTLLWSGSDARVHAEICEALEHKGIPLRSLDTDDYLFNLTMRPAHKVYVPAELVNSARDAVKQVADMEESENPAETDVLEIPADEAPDYEEYEEHRPSHRLDPEDASVEIWSGQAANLAAMIASSLRENGIPYRRDPELLTPKSRKRREPQMNCPPRGFWYSQRTRSAPAKLSAKSSVPPHPNDAVFGHF